MGQKNAKKLGKDFRVNEHFVHPLGRNAEKGIFRVSRKPEIDGGRGVTLYGREVRPGGKLGPEISILLPKDRRIEVA